MARLSPLLLAAGALAVLGLTGCDQTEKAVAQPTELAAPAAPDPAAPAPGTQAAEAIGADSSESAVIPPEKQRH